MKEYYSLPAENVIEEQKTSPEGLRGEEAAERLGKYGPNRLKEEKKPSLLKRFFDQLKDPMLLILLAAAAVSAVTGMASGETQWTEVIILTLGLQAA